MPRVSIAGLGARGPGFGSWNDLRLGIRNGCWADTTAPQPQRIPPKERRRIPEFVKMALDVMDQACVMAGQPAEDIAVVFSSAMGDMAITDYMCSTLAQTPGLISPTRFHNSVHNAAPGYWSIFTRSFQPATAISAYEFSSSIALLEAATQAADENVPVLIVTQELAAPFTLKDICPTEDAFALALLLIPHERDRREGYSIDVGVAPESSDWPDAGNLHLQRVSGPLCARLLPLFVTLAQPAARSTVLSFPLAPASTLNLRVTVADVD